MTGFRRSMFGAPWNPLPDPLSSTSVGHRRLAARVIFQAFRDLESPGTTAEHRLSARTFLTGSSMLEYWCEMAQTETALVIAHAQARAATPSGGLLQQSTVIDPVLVKAAE